MTNSSSDVLLAIGIIVRRTSERMQAEESAMVDTMWRSSFDTDGRAPSRMSSALRLVLLITFVGVTSAVLFAAVCVELVSRLAGASS